MSKEIFPCIIPICNEDWKRRLEWLAYSAPIKTDENPYKKMRFYEDLQWDAGLPRFFPNEKIELADGVVFRVTVSLSLYLSKCDEMVTIPWAEELVPYNEGSWYTVEKLINDHSNCVIILKSESDYKDEILDKVIAICNEYSRPYKIVRKLERPCYNDLKEWFFNDGKED